MVYRAFVMRATEDRAGLTLDALNKAQPNHPFWRQAEQLEAGDCSHKLFLWQDREQGNPQRGQEFSEIYHCPTTPTQS